MPAEALPMRSPELAVDDAVAPREDPAERLAALADPPAAVALPSGRRVVVERGAQELVTVYDPAGHVELAIRLTAEGPVLTLQAAALHLSSQGTLALDCERLQVRAREAIELASGGSLRQQVRGDAVTVAGGAVRAEGARIDLEARDEDVQIDAAGDVAVNGARVLLNC